MNAGIATVLSIAIVAAAAAYCIYQGIQYARRHHDDSTP